VTSGLRRTITRSTVKRTGRLFCSLRIGLFAPQGDVDVVRELDDVEQTLSDVQVHE
jgi:hypothetical protein